MRHGLRALALVTLFAVPMLGDAAPIVMSGYSIDLYASGVGAANEMAIGPDGRVYVVDYGGRVLAVNANGSLDVLATGVANGDGLTFTQSGRLFADSAFGTVYEVAGGTATPYATGFPNSVSLEGVGEDVFVSGNGYIRRIAADSSVSDVLAVAGTAYGLTFGADGLMYYILHETGAVYAYDLLNAPQQVAAVTPYGGTFTGFGFDSNLYFTDVNLGTLYFVDQQGNQQLFGSGFVAKSGAPRIGPQGIAYDGLDALYVGDGDSIWRITRPASVPEPGTLALLGLGLAGLGLSRRRKA